MTTKKFPFKDFEEYAIPKKGIARLLAVDKFLCEEVWDWLVSKNLHLDLLAKAFSMRETTFIKKWYGHRHMWWRVKDGQLRRLIQVCREWEKNPVEKVYPYYLWDNTEDAILDYECETHDGITVFIFKVKVRDLREHSRDKQPDYMWMVIVVRDNDCHLAIRRYMGDATPSTQGVAKAFAYKQYRIWNDLVEKNHERYMEDDGFTNTLLREGDAAFGEQACHWMANKDYTPHYCRYEGYIEEYKRRFNPDCKIQISEC